MSNSIEFNKDNMVISVDKHNDISLTITSEYLLEMFGATDLIDLTDDQYDGLLSLIPNKENYNDVALCLVDAEYLHRTLDNETQIM